MEPEVMVNQLNNMNTVPQVQEVPEIQHEPEIINNIPNELPENPLNTGVGPELEPFDGVYSINSSVF